MINVREVKLENTPKFILGEFKIVASKDWRVSGKLLNSPSVVIVTFFRIVHRGGNAYKHDCSRVSGNWNSYKEVGKKLRMEWVNEQIPGNDSLLSWDGNEFNATFVNSKMPSICSEVSAAGRGKGKDPLSPFEESSKSVTDEGKDDSPEFVTCDSNKLSTFRPNEK